MSNSSERVQVLLDQAASGQLSRRRFLTAVSTAGLAAGLSGAAVEHALAAGENQAFNQAQLKGAYDYIVVGGGASGSIIAGELSKTGAKVLLVESGGADNGPTISNPSIWFDNVGVPLDWKLPIAPVPQLNDRKFNMALGHVLGGGSSINAMVWTRGMALDYDAWERSGGEGWGFKDVLPICKAQEDWEGGADQWRGIGGTVQMMSAAFLKDATDPQWNEDPGMVRYRDFLSKHMPDANRSDAVLATGYTTAQAVELVLRRCGDNLTRDNVMKRAANFERVSFDLLLPGIEVNTSPRDFTAIKDMNLMRFDQESWKLFGGLVRARASE
jgi:hypothetical protein